MARKAQNEKQFISLVDYALMNYFDFSGVDSKKMIEKYRYLIGKNYRQEFTALDCAKTVIKTESEIFNSSQFVPVYEIEGTTCTLVELIEANKHDESFFADVLVNIVQIKVGETIGEGLNMATIKRVK